MTNAETIAAAHDRLREDADLARGLARAWFPVARSSELNRPVLASILGIEVVSFRDEEGHARVIQNRCPHRGASLSQGTVVGSSIQCPYHGWRWDGESGRCTAIPAIGPHGTIPRAARVRAFAAEERYGLVWTTLSDTPLGGAPYFEEFERGEWEGDYITCQTWEVGCNISAAIENFRDVAHLPFVHRKTMGTIPPEVEPLTPRRVNFEVFLPRTRQKADPTTADPNWSASHREQLELLYHAIAPSAVGLFVSGSETGHRMLLFAVAPVTLEASRWYLVARNGLGYPIPAEDLLETARRITDEDVDVLERVRPQGFEGMNDPIHCIADAYTLKYREAFVEFITHATALAD